MVVTPSTRDRQPEKAPARHIDRPGQSIGLILTDIDRGMGGRPQEPPGRPDGCGIGKPQTRPRRQQVTGHLLGHESSQRQVGIESLDHVIPIAPGIGNIEIKLMGHGLSKAGEV